MTSQQSKEEAKKEKEIGNQLYKKRDFQGALEHYINALKLDNTDIVFYNNIGAVLFETGDLPRCIEICLKAVSVGLGSGADFPLTAKYPATFLKISLFFTDFSFW